MDGEEQKDRRVSVIADDRERDPALREALLALPELEVRWKRLVLGDFLVDQRLIVERKTVLDFAVSVVDGRLFSQCRRLAGCGLCPVLVLEGTQAMLAGRAFSRDALLGAMVTVQLVFGIPVLRSVSPSETVRLLRIVACQTARLEAGRVHRPGYRPRSRRGRQSFLLQGASRHGSGSRPAPVGAFRLGGGRDDRVPGGSGARARHRHGALGGDPRGCPRRRRGVCLRLCIDI